MVSLVIYIFILKYYSIWMPAGARRTINIYIWVYTSLTERMEKGIYIWELEEENTKTNLLVSPKIYS
jgi:hypothetical protein